MSPAANSKVYTKSESGRRLKPITELLEEGISDELPKFRKEPTRLARFKLLWLSINPSRIATEQGTDVNIFHYRFKKIFYHPIYGGL